jgi:hypothetical protein
LRHAVAGRPSANVAATERTKNVVVYALAAVTLASLLLGASPWWVHLLYFFFTGLLWVLPAMLIIKWMEKPAADH